MKRREFITLLGCTAVTWPLAAHAQQATMPVIGVLHIASPGAYVYVVAGLRRGLAETDFVEGRNITVEYRWGEGQLGRMPSLLADLLDHQVSVIVASLQGAQAAKSAGVTIPVVFSTSDDPVKQGFVETLNRPGGNMTGAYLFTAELEGKRLGLLHDLLPKATMMAALVDASHPVAVAQLREVKAAAARLGVQLVVLRANSDHDFEAAFATLMKQKAEALLVCASPSFLNRRDQLVALAARHNIPAAFEFPSSPRLAGFWPIVTALQIYTDSLASMPVAFSKAPSPPICPWFGRASSSWCSISKPRGRSASISRTICSYSPTR